VGTLYAAISCQLVVGKQDEVAILVIIVTLPAHLAVATLLVILVICRQGSGWEGVW
jgi:hypothetical protein